MTHTLFINPTKRNLLVAVLHTVEDLLNRSRM